MAPGISCSYYYYYYYYYYHPAISRRFIPRILDHCDHGKNRLDKRRPRV